MKVTFLGQACILVEAAGRKILTDPWLTEGANLGTWFHAHLLSDAGISPAWAARQGIDYLFLSHEHQDHVDPETLKAFPSDIPVLICRFPTPRFRTFLEGIGLTNIRELDSGAETDLGDGLKVTIFNTAEYTNDSAILIEAEGRSVFNETDCKLSYDDYNRLAAKRIDLGFYMFSGANWYPILYDFPEETMRQYVKRRRATLLKSFIRRVHLTRPRHAVPAAGPCAVLDPDLFWLNTRERGIFIDPREAVTALAEADGDVGMVMAASDTWDSEKGLQVNSPASFHGDRMEYLADASRRMRTECARWKQEEAPAGADLSRRVIEYFTERVEAQDVEMRRLIGARLLVETTGDRAGSWMVDFNAPDVDRCVTQGEARDWTYRIRTEDRCLYPFVSGRLEFLEDMLLSLRVALARRPDVYNEPLYHFLYDPDPVRLRNWYAKTRA